MIRGTNEKLLRQNLTQAKSTLGFSNLWNEGISNVGEWTCVANNKYGYIKRAKKPTYTFHVSLNVLFKKTN